MLGAICWVQATPRMRRGTLIDHQAQAFLCNRPMCGFWPTARASSALRIRHGQAVVSSTIRDQDILSV